MKHVSMTIVVSLCFLNLLIAQNGYTIKGHINGLTDNSKIYLIDGGRKRTIDSATVRNNNFVLKGSIAEAAHSYLYQGKTNKLADILLDNREIVVTGTQPIYDSIKISGSDIDEQWKEWYKEDQRIGYLRYRLIRISESLDEQSDTATSNQIKTIADQLMTDRISFLKLSVKMHGNAASGALLPTLCTIQKQLTKDDLLEMYNSLSIEMKNTNLGNEIKKLSYNK